MAFFRSNMELKHEKAVDEKEEAVAKERILSTWWTTWSTRRSWEGVGGDRGAVRSKSRDGGGLVGNGAGDEEVTPYERLG